MSVAVAGGVAVAIGIAVNIGVAVAISVAFDNGKAVDMGVADVEAVDIGIALGAASAGKQCNQKDPQVWFGVGDGNEGLE